MSRHAAKNREKEPDSTPVAHGAGHSAEAATARDIAPGLQRAAGNRAVASLAQRGGGEALNPETRAEMEARFGHDFSDVRIHNDEAAVNPALASGARALATGRDIVFSPGFYSPQSAEGKRLLAHELAHVVQQSGAQQTRSATSLGTPGATAESEARQAGADVAAGNAASVQSVAPAGPQADLMTKEEIEKQIGLIDAKNIASMPLDEANAVFQQREALLAQWKTAPSAPPAPQPAPPPPQQTAEEKQKASDAQALAKAGISEQQVKDYMMMTHGDVMEKYGFFEFWKIRSAARSLGPAIVGRMLPKPDTTVYIHPSGRVGTIANEQAHQLAEMQPPSGTAGILMTGGEAYSYITKGKGLELQDLKNLQALGDNLEGLGAGVAAVGQGRAANRAVTNSVENQPRRATVTVVQPQKPEAPTTPPPAAPVNAPPSVAQPAVNPAVNDVTPPVVTPQPQAAPPPQAATAQPPAQTPVPITNAPETVFWRDAEQSAVAKTGGLDLNTKGKSNFAGVDVVSTNELTSVKAYSGPTAVTRNINDLQELCGGRGPMGSGSKVSKTVKDIGRLDKQMKAAGTPLPLPSGYAADPEAYIQDHAVLRIPDDYVGQTQDAIVKDLTDPKNPYGYQNYGLKSAPTLDEAKAFAAKRVKGVGKTSKELGK